MGPYAYRDNQWVGYDDVDSIRRKSQYIRDMNLGGGMIWALDLDDFNNRCGQGRHPLMNTIKSVLGPAKENFDNDEEVTTEVDGGSSTDEKIEMIEEAIEENQDSNVIIEESDKDESNFKDIDDEEENENEEDYKVVCYFTNWAWYRPETGKYQPEDIEADLCTHIVYGFAVLDPETLTVKAHDTWADFDNGKAEEKKITFASAYKCIHLKNPLNTHEIHMSATQEPLFLPLTCLCSFILADFRGGFFQMDAFVSGCKCNLLLNNFYRNVDDEFSFPRFLQASNIFKEQG